MEDEEYSRKFYNYTISMYFILYFLFSVYQVNSFNHYSTLFKSKSSYFNSDLTMGIKTDMIQRLGYISKQAVVSVGIAVTTVLPQSKSTNTERQIQDPIELVADMKPILESKTPTPRRKIYGNSNSNNNNNNPNNKATAKAAISASAATDMVQSSSSNAEASSDVKVKQLANHAALGSSFVRDSVKVVGPSVVRVDCEREIPQMMGLFTDLDTVKVSGSGFVVADDGYMLTNAHVVEGSKRITVSLSNGRTYKAELVAFDELTDLALLKAATGKDRLPVAPMGNSASLSSGDWVIAVGCPVGLDFTVTLGIVSNPKRSAFEVGAPHMKGAFIQTDAALNQGNSGGPLVNEEGKVVGINTMVRTNTEAIGFAIPINRAQEIYKVLRQGKKPSHAYFGLEAMSLTPDFARIHNDDPNAQRLPCLHGALVVRVVPGSPAAQAGLRKNDIVRSVNGFNIASADDADAHLD